MSDHQAATARASGSSNPVRGTQPFNGFSRPPVGPSVDDTSAQPASQGLASTTSSWIWGGSAPSGGGIGSSFSAATGGTERRGPVNDDNYLHPNSGSFDGKQGSSVLLPGSGEHDGWGKPSAVGWAGESTSPALSSVGISQDMSRSPVRIRNTKYDSPKQSTEIPRSSSPFYGMPRQGAVGQGSALSQSPNNKAFLDAASNSGFGDQLLARGRPLEIGKYSTQRMGGGSGSVDADDRRHLGSILNSGIDNEDSAGLRRGRGLSNSRGLVPPGAEILASGTRSESLPPQHRANSTPPVYPAQSSPDGPGYSSYTHLPTSNPGSHAATHSMQGRFNDVGRETREAELLAKLSKTGIDDDNDQYNSSRQRLQYSQFSQTPPVNSGPSIYPPTFEYSYQRQPGSHNPSPWSPDDPTYRSDAYVSEQYTAEGGFPEAYGDRLRSYERSGAMSPPDQNGDYRRNLGSPFYPSAGTPPSGLDYRSPSRGGASSRTPQSGQYPMLPPDKLRQQLLQTQQQQRGLPHTGQPLIGDIYRFPPYNALEYGQNGGLRMQMPYPGSIIAPTHPAARRPQEEYSNLRSPVLDDFRTNSKSNKRFELRDIYNHVVEFSGDQHGSRFIQQKLETANSDEKEIVFNEIKPNTLQLMTDVFGNYVIQKFFEHGNQVQKGILAKQMEGHVLTLSLQMYGCRVVQKALEHILTDQQAALVKELDGNVLKCVKDQNGNHVIQKAIERVPAEYIQFIINAFHGQVQQLATHPYGCRVIQRMLEHCEEDAKASLLQELHMCAGTLVQDQYGNYVTQHVIEQGKPEDQAKIISLVTSQLLQFSKHKFASNVVEKSIAHGNDEQKREIVKTLTTLRPDGSSPLQALMRDQYGNYVIQKLLVLLSGPDREYLVEQIKPQLMALKKYTFGKQINAIEKLIYVNADGPSQASSPPPGSAQASPPLSNKDAQSPGSPTPSANTSTTAGSDGPGAGAKKPSIAVTSEGVKIAT